MDDRGFRRVGAVAAWLVAVASVIYAVAFLIITPSPQRHSNVGAFFRSYLAHPAGLRVASVCLTVSGILAGVAIVALRASLPPERRAAPLAQWATMAGVAAGLATAMHGLGDLFTVDKLAHRFATGDATVRAVVTVSHAAPSPVDPRGIMTFGVAGVVAIALGVAVSSTRPALARVGVAYGVDLIMLFVATATGLNPLVLITGGLASLVLGPIWWVGASRVIAQTVSSGSGGRWAPPPMGVERPVARTA
jgi:hypothetical protein